MNYSVGFEPDWVSPPGDTIKDVLAARQLGLDVFGQRTGLGREEVELLLCGGLPIDGELAQRLSATLDTSREFWVKRETHYRLRLQKQSSKGLEEAQADFLKQLPLSDMRKYGWLIPFAQAANDNAALKFFEDEVGDWRENGLRLMKAVQFRTSFAHATNPAAVAAWLRQGVLQANKINCEEWKPEALRAAIPELRSLSRTKLPADFFPRLVDICRACGVAVVSVPTPSGCRASGATHFASDQKAIIQLSFRYRADDHFWFTFFHEVAHLLLHGNSSLFVEGNDYIESNEEAEANAFSARVLIPVEYEAELEGLGRKFSQVMRFAKRIGVSAGVVVGQMQHRGMIRPSEMNFLKVRYNWDDVSALSP